jgi:hypothetical protein
VTRGIRRILFVHYTTPQILGGVEQVMAAHIAGLRAVGKDVAMLAGRGGAKPPGVRVIRVAEADSRHPAVERDLAALSSGVVPPEHPRLVARLLAKIRPHVARADRVVVHNVMTMPLNLALTSVLATLARESPGRFIAWTHDISYFDERYAALRRKGAPWDLVTQAVPGVRYVAVSEERAEQLSRGASASSMPTRCFSFRSGSRPANASRPRSTRPRPSAGAATPRCSSSRGQRDRTMPPTRPTSRSFRREPRRWKAYTSSRRSA